MSTVGRADTDDRSSYPHDVSIALYRGGSSKGVLVERTDVADIDESDLLAWVQSLMGAPDPRQIDGLGGAEMLTSKFGIVGASSDSDHDIDFDFFQVGVKESTVARDGACGNLSAAVALHAVNVGLAPAPPCSVRIRDVNTGATIVGEVLPFADTGADGAGMQVPGSDPATGVKVVLDFAGAAGATTGALLPTMARVDTFDIDEVGQIEMSILDLANPVAFIRADAVGLTGSETPAQVESDTALMGRLERIRATAAVRLGLAPDVQSASSTSPGVPFLAMISGYEISGVGVETSDSERIEPTRVRALGFAMRTVHRAYWATGAACTAAAAKIPGTVVHDIARVRSGGAVVISHPAGELTVDTEIVEEAGQPRVVRAAIPRTARLLLRGRAFVPERPRVHLE